MKALLKFLYVLLLIVIILLLAGIFLPDSQSLKTDVAIHAKPELIFDQLNTPMNWKNWSPWMAGDSLISIRTKGSQQGTGAGLEWNSLNYGKAQMEISRSIPDKLVAGNMDLGEYGKANFVLTLEEKDNRILLKWDFTLKDIGYFERYFMFLFRKQLQDSFRDALDRVRMMAEELRLSRINNPRMIEVEELPLMLIIDTVRAAEFDSVQQQAFRRVRSYLERRKIDIAGDGLTVYYEYDPQGDIIYGNGYPIPKRTWSWSDYQCVVISTCRAATVTHWGNYASPKPYLALDKFLAEKKLEPDSFIWEVYHVDRSPQTDSSLWEKQLFYPLKDRVKGM